MESYDALDFNLIKQEIAKEAQFKLSNDYILNLNPSFNKLYVKRELKRAKDVYITYKEYGNIVYGNLKDITKILLDIKKGKIVVPQEICDVNDLLKACQITINYFDDIKDSDSFNDLVDAIKVYPMIVKKIESCINREGNIIKDATVELKTLYRRVDNIEERIDSKTASLLKRYKDSLMDNITVLRNGRRCLLVKISDKHKIHGLIHDETASGQACYIEPSSLLELNNELQSVYASIEEEEFKIVKEICELLYEQIDGIIANLETITLIDSYLARAKWCEKVDGVYASINDDKHLLFKEARHPLILEDKVVSNTYELKAPKQHLIISGSNTGGKTVSLKIIGLFTVMSLSGLPVSALEASIPCFDGVFMDIGDGQSVLESLSTFSAHLTHLANISKLASQNSLVLIDELGSGTDPLEGECLALAFLDSLIDKKCMSVVTTHYNKVKEKAIKEDCMEIGAVNFDVDKMQPTYKFITGFSGNSNAIEIAKRYGIDDDILNRAVIYKEENQSEANKLLNELDKQKLILNDREDKINQLHEEVDNLKNSYDLKLKELNDQIQKKLDEANHEAESILHAAKLKAKKVIKEIRNKDEIKQHEENEILQELNVENNEEKIIEKDYKFNVGDYVSIDGLQYHGEITSIKGKNASVLCNGMKMNVKVDRLTPTSRPQTKKVATYATKKTSSKMKQEVNLIGMHVSEALNELDKHLDNALYHHYTQIRVIHGNGSGTLRKAVWDYLKKNKYVKEYRIGGEGEGGTGATVVTLKNKNG